MFFNAIFTQIQILNYHFNKNKVYKYGVFSCKNRNCFCQIVSLSAVKILKIHANFYESCEIDQSVFNYLWTNSGNVSLTAYKSSTTRFAFKYKSTTSGATSYQLDDIVIREKL